MAANIIDLAREVLTIEAEGLATLPEDAQDREGLLNVADKALFSSKGRGKDRIMLGRDLTPAAEA